MEEAGREESEKMKDEREKGKAERRGRQIKEKR
jgi:hypothetical protein